MPKIEEELEARAAGIFARQDAAPFAELADAMAMERGAREIAALRLQLDFARLGQLQAKALDGLAAGAEGGDKVSARHDGGRGE